MGFEIIDRVNDNLMNNIAGSPLIFGLILLTFFLIWLLVLKFPKWAILVYSSTMLIVLCAPNYHPVLLPEWVFYIVLIFLGILWGFVIIKFKGGG